MSVIWRSGTLAHPDFALAWWLYGEGPPLLLLHGGPGDTHEYLGPVAEVLGDRFRCILFDQRGTGGSLLTNDRPESLTVDHVIEDITALLDHLGIEQAAILGHSWGAILALFYAIAVPERVRQLVLVSMGPLNPEMERVASDNLLKPLTALERTELTRLRDERSQQRTDPARLAAIERRMMVLRARGWFFASEAADRFLADFEPRTDRRVNKAIWRSAQTWPLRARLDRVRADVLVLYGYQDFEPIVQAYLVREAIPGTEIAYLDRCGHVPWLEQPNAFSDAVQSFLVR